MGCSRKVEAAVARKLDMVDCRHSNRCGVVGGRTGRQRAEPARLVDFGRRPEASRRGAGRAGWRGERVEPAVMESRCAECWCLPSVVERNCAPCAARLGGQVRALRLTKHGGSRAALCHVLRDSRNKIQQLLQLCDSQALDQLALRHDSLTFYPGAARTRQLYPSQRFSLVS